MEYSFPRYLLAKQTVDDRALSRTVLESLKTSLPEGRIRIIEVGAGMGTMLARLIDWDVIAEAEYWHVDSMAENIDFALEWLPKWAQARGLQVDRSEPHELRILGGGHDVKVILRRQDVFEFSATKPDPADLLIASAFLDLLPMPRSLAPLLSLTRNLAWLTINFDGVTSFEPTIDAELDDQIERLYHRTMDTRPTGGDSRSGRHLYSDLVRAGAEILTAGPSDWVVYPRGGKYPADEAYFLHFVLHFFEESLSVESEISQESLRRWLTARRGQVDRGELFFQAHQLDYLVRV